MNDRIWDKFLTERDKAVFTAGGLLPNQLSCERGKPLETATLMTVLNDNVLSFNLG